MLLSAQQVSTNEIFHCFYLPHMQLSMTLLFWHQIYHSENTSNSSHSSQAAFANSVSTLHSGVLQLGRLLHQPYIASASIGSTSPGEWINTELNQSVYGLINLM